MSEVRAEVQDAEEPPGRREPVDRAQDLLGRKESRLRKELVEVWNTVLRGFQDQSERADRIMDYWDAYNCVLNAEQYYDGDAQIFIPIIRDAVDARTTRAINQLFPSGAQLVDVTDSEGNSPRGILSALEEYMRRADFKELVIRPLLLNGDIEGQYNLYIDWSEIERQVVSRETRRPTVEVGGQEMDDPGGEEFEDMSEEDILEARPGFEVLHDSDVLIWPASADTVDEALGAGGGVAIVRRWSKTKVEKMIDAGHVNADDGEQLIEQMGIAYKGSQGTPPDVDDTLSEHVGIRKKGRELTVWEVWKMLPLDDGGRYSKKSGTPRICRIFFGPDQTALGCVRNPHWNDRVPLLSRSVKKVAGTNKGQPPVHAVISLQYEANDAINEGADVAHYSAMPIILRNPQATKQPLVLNIGAVWDVDPSMVRFAEFPDLTPRAATRIQYCIAQTFQSLSVNPSMLPQQTRVTRRNQAEVAQEQAIDLLTNIEFVSIIKNGILTPAMEMCIDLDYQYRDQAMWALMHGAEGVRATLEQIPPRTTRSRYNVQWVGDDYTRNAAMIQQQIAGMNVLRGVEPILAQQGYTINLAPAVESWAISAFGAQRGRQIVRDQRANMSLDPQLENELMAEGNLVPVHMLDDDQQHLIAHQQAVLAGDPHQVIALHIQAHLRQRGLKSQAMMMQQMQQLMQGQQPQGGQRSSRSGQVPRTGAQPVGPQQQKSPAGSIGQDRMPAAGGLTMPRSM